MKESVAILPTGTCFECSLQDDWRKTEANARLVAAAPELLDALKELEENARMASAFVPHVLLIHAIETAQKAIAKAEGE